MWSELFTPNNMPSFENISGFVNNELWDELCTYLGKNYVVTPKLDYSKCSMQKGWNVKYKKGGKSICTLYPMKGYFIVLIVIGEKELLEAEMIMPTCSGYVQQLFYEASHSVGGKWLMIEVRERNVLEDVLKLTKLRVKPIIKSI